MRMTYKDRALNALLGFDSLVKDIEAYLKNIGQRHWTVNRGSVVFATMPSGQSGVYFTRKGVREMKKFVYFHELDLSTGGFVVDTMSKLYDVTLKYVEAEVGYIEPGAFEVSLDREKGVHIKGMTELGPVNQYIEIAVLERWIEENKAELLNERPELKSDYQQYCDLKDKLSRAGWPI